MKSIAFHWAILFIVYVATGKCTYYAQNKISHCEIANFGFYGEVSVPISIRLVRFSVSLEGINLHLLPSVSKEHKVSS